jgi:hypothetical protein
MIVFDLRSMGNWMNALFTFGAFESGDWRQNSKRDDGVNVKSKQDALVGPLWVGIYQPRGWENASFGLVFTTLVLVGKIQIALEYSNRPKLGSLRVENSSASRSIVYGLCWWNVYCDLYSDE